MCSKIRLFRFLSAVMLMLSALIAAPQLSANNEILDKQEMATQEQVNINVADATTIAKTLDGVGESRAKAIVAYRDKHGPYRSVEELAEVKGVGLRTLELNRQKIRLK